MVVRCLLKGRGTAWFDDVRVDDRPYGAPVELTAIEPDEEGRESKDSPSGNTTLMDTLMDANEALRKTLKTITATNELLLRQIEALDARLETLEREARGANRPIQLETSEPLQPLTQPGGAQNRGAP